MAVAMIGLLGNENPKLGCELLRRFQDRRRSAFQLRRFNRFLFASDADLKSLARCGNPLGAVVTARKGPDGRIRPGGVATCKSVWGCLGCAARRRALRSAMVKHYVQAHHALGKGISMSSFTLAHYLSDQLVELISGLKKAFVDMRHLKVYRDAEAEYGIIGWICALEITHGINGWHSHLHVLFFHDKHLEVEYGENADLRAALHEAFARQIDRHLGRPVHQVHGVDLTPVKPEGSGADTVGKYLSKIQLEMTRQDLKTAKVSTSRSPWQIGLDAAETGDAHDAALWAEYIRATKGRNVVTRSKSLAEIYGDPTEKELYALLGDRAVDDDLGDPDHDEGGEEVASFDADVWYDLVNRANGPTGSAVSEALAALESEEDGQAGAEVAAEVATHRLGKPVHVIIHHETRLPHLQYRNPLDRRRPQIEPPAPSWRPRADVDIDDLGEIGRSYFRI